jgi:hypothetical protein
MRRFVLTTCLLVFAGHSKAETPTSAPLSTPAPTTLATADPTPNSVSPTPTPSPIATPSPPETPQPTAPAVGERKTSYEGTWTITDARGSAFDIIVFKNGQAVTTWVKGPAGARGERGYWRSDQQRLSIVYTSGCTDFIQPDDGKFSYSRYEAGSALDGEPTLRAEARRLANSQVALIGVWRLNQEPDGSHLYIALQSNGTAFSTINGTTSGKWKPNESGALCEWPDGWIDQIERGAGGWQKRSWVGSDSGAPADLSPATRVGETRFSTEP